MSEQYEKVSDGAKNALDKFSSNKYVDGTSEFLNSNSIIAKFAFLLLVIVIFFLLLRLGASLLTWIVSPSPNPILLKGSVDGTTTHDFTQDPKITGSIPILRSVDDVTGVEFTWSIWIFVKDSNFHINKERHYKHIFHKGNKNHSSLGLSTPNNSPGLYLDSKNNNLLVLMNTFTEPTIAKANMHSGTKEPESIEIKDIPVNKWMNVIIRVSKQNQVDVYINGTLMKREIMNGIVKQNYENVHVSSNGGFHGYISELRYFNSAIGTNQIQTIVDNGPNLTPVYKSSKESAIPRYLSTRWFFSDSGNLYNPTHA